MRCRPHKLPTYLHMHGEPDFARGDDDKRTTNKHRLAARGSTRTRIRRGGAASTPQPLRAARSNSQLASRNSQPNARRTVHRAFLGCGRVCHCHIRAGAGAGAGHLGREPLQHRYSTVDIDDVRCSRRAPSGDSALGVVCLRMAGAVWWVCMCTVSCAAGVGYGGLEFGWCGDGLEVCSGRDADGFGCRCQTVYQGRLHQYLRITISQATREGQAEDREAMQLAR